MALIEINVDGELTISIEKGNEYKFNNMRIIQNRGENPILVSRNEIGNSSKGLELENNDMIIEDSNVDRYIKLTQGQSQLVLVDNDVS